MAKFMQKSGYGTLASAQVNLGKVLRKVFKTDDAGEGTPPKKITGKKRKAGKCRLWTHLLDQGANTIDLSSRWRR